MPHISTKRQFSWWHDDEILDEILTTYSWVFVFCRSKTLLRVLISSLSGPHSKFTIRSIYIQVVLILHSMTINAKTFINITHHTLTLAVSTSGSPAMLLRPRAYGTFRLCRPIRMASCQRCAEYSKARVLTNLELIIILHLAYIVM